MTRFFLLSHRPFHLKGGILRYFFRIVTCLFSMDPSSSSFITSFSFFQSAYSSASTVSIG